MEEHAGIRHCTSEIVGGKECLDNYIHAADLAYVQFNQELFASSFQFKVNHKAVQIVDSNKITHMIRCAWNASSMYSTFRIVPQLHSDTVL